MANLAVAARVTERCWRIAGIRNPHAVKRDVERRFARGCRRHTLADGAHVASRRTRRLDPRAGCSPGSGLRRTSPGSAAWSFRSGCGKTRKAPSQAAAVSIAVAAPLKPRRRGMHGMSCSWRPPSIRAARPRGLATACDSSCRGHRARSCRSLDQFVVLGGLAGCRSRRKNVTPNPCALRKVGVTGKKCL